MSTNGINLRERRGCFEKIGEIGLSFREISDGRFVKVAERTGYFRKTTIRLVFVPLSPLSTPQQFAVLVNS